MKAAKAVCIVLVFVLAIISTAFSQEAARCRADLKMWVPVFKAIYDAPECQGDGTIACGFAAPIKNLTSGQLPPLFLRWIVAPSWTLMAITTCISVWPRGQKTSSSCARRTF
jgi:hypothetical protein